MSEQYRFRYKGQEFAIQLEGGDDLITTDAPNLHVMAGSWRTWHLDPGTHGGPRPRLLRSVSPNDPNVEHPAGNLSHADSDSDGGILCVDSDGTVTGVVGRLYQRPVGSATVWRMHNN